jgi:serine phosphatase RsbU (regulator of sigma subunit)
MRIAFFCLIFIFSGCFQNVLSQISTVGSLPCVNYSPKTYLGGAQVYRGFQNDDGLVTIVSSLGLSTYDGVSWCVGKFGVDIAPSDAIQISNDSLVICHSSGLSLTTYDENNNLQGFVKIKKFENKEIFGVKLFGDKLIVFSESELFICNRKFEILNQFNGDYLFSIVIVNDQLYFGNGDKGLYQYIDDKFLPFILLNELQDVNFAQVISFQEHLYVVTDSKGIFRIENNKLGKRVYYNSNISILSVLNIQDEFLSIGTFAQGVEVLNSDFEITNTVTPKKGLNNGSIKKQFLDREGLLWLCTSNGLSKVDVMSSSMHYDYLFSEATIEAVSEYKNEVVLATGGGSFSILPDGTVRKNTSILNDCYGQDLIDFYGDTSLYISGLYGMYKYDGKDQAELICEGGPYQAAKWSGDSSALFIVNYDGLQKLKYKNGKFTEVGYIKNFGEGEPYNFVIEDDGTIWVGTKPDDGIYISNVDVFNDPAIGFEHLGRSNGLPKGPCYIVLINDEVYVGSENGLLKFNETANTFELTDEFDYDFHKERISVHRVNQDSVGNIWMVLYSNRKDIWEIGYSAKGSYGTYVWHSESFLGYNEEIIHSIYHRGNGISWLGGVAGVLRFDMKNVNYEESQFDAIIRGVFWGSDTTYGGYGEPKQDFVYNYNSRKQLKFQFASNTFKEEEKVLYSYKLEGFDDDWSAWSRKTDKEYTLSEGDYIFKVRAKSIYGVISSEDSIKVQILPPWYRTNWAYILFFVLAAILVYIIIRLALYRAKQQNIRLEKIIEERTEEIVAQKDEAEKQRHLVEEKNLEILDSIAYAKRLQDAILTPIDVIQETFTDSFILFLPKDIVAGDFYWTNFAKLNSRDKVNLIAAADCTGHGVPGAMVSVVCSNALDRAAKEFGLQNPGKILDKVTSLVIETFEKSVDAVKDGMDIALSSFEKMDDYVELTYAGANNPAWIVSKNETIHINNKTTEAIMNLEGYFLFEIKATKQPVGNYANIKPFESHCVKLTKGDAVYMFTDGYADQFGGEKGKKYKYKPFKRLILSIQDQSMDEQNKLLNKEFIDWQGELEQIDDVCVIGVKI